jgi:hypothetical protein
VGGVAGKSQNSPTATARAWRGYRAGEARVGLAWGEGLGAALAVERASGLLWGVVLKLGDDVIGDGVALSSVKASLRPRTRRRRKRVGVKVGEACGLDHLTICTPAKLGQLRVDLPVGVTSRRTLHSGISADPSQFFRR